MVCKPWSSKQIISVGLKCGPHRTHSEPEEICWLCEGNLHQGQISFMLHQHDVVLMLKVHMSGSCTVSRLSSLAAVQHHLKMQIWTTPDTELQKQARLQSKNYKCQYKCVATAVMVNRSWDSTCIWHTDSSTPLPGTDGMAIQDKY